MRARPTSRVRHLSTPLLSLAAVLALVTTNGGTASATSTDLVLRVSPSNFANVTFQMNDGASRVVSPGFLVGLQIGIPRGIYSVSLESPTLAKDYVLTISVRGRNIRILRRGGPFTSDLPRFRLTSVGDSLVPAVVTVTLRRGHSPTTTTTVTTTSTTTTTTIAQ